MKETPILSVKNLKTYFYQKDELIKAVDDVSFAVYPGKITALVGESGSGKSITALSIFKLIEAPGQLVSGQVVLNGRDLVPLPEKTMMKIRGKEMSLIFQDPVGAMNPIVKIKKQLQEAIHIHQKGAGKKASLERCREMLKKVGLKEPEKIMESYPFELSGGMCQRVMIAMALLARPGLLIADEPTTSLDLTIQAAILRELVRLKEEGMAILLITHDLGVVAQTADELYVMYQGKIVEGGPVQEIFKSPVHDYTRALFNAIIE